MSETTIGLLVVVAVAVCVSAATGSVFAVAWMDSHGVVTWGDLWRALRGRR